MEANGESALQADLKKTFIYLDNQFDNGLTLNTGIGFETRHHLLQKNSPKQLIEGACVI
jgi:hypothetical protein